MKSEKREKNIEQNCLIRKIRRLGEEENYK